MNHVISNPYFYEIPGQLIFSKVSRISMNLTQSYFMIKLKVSKLIYLRFVIYVAYFINGKIEAVF